MVSISRGSTGDGGEASALLSVLIDECRQFHDDEMTYLKSLDLPKLLERQIEQAVLHHKELLRRLDEIHSSAQPFCQHEAILTRLEMMDVRGLLERFVAEHPPTPPILTAPTQGVASPSMAQLEALMAQFQDQHNETMAKLSSIDLHPAMIKFAHKQMQFQSEVRERLDRIEKGGWWYQIKLVWNKIFRRTQGDS